MFQKVLIAEDHGCTSLGLQLALKEFNIELEGKSRVYNCDLALRRITKALSEGEPYELLITDLSFDGEFEESEITDGQALIKAVKEIQPDLKIIVFSVEARASVANSLFKELNIDGYVPKGQGDMADLKQAIQNVYGNKKHLSQHLVKTNLDEVQYHFSEFERTIVSLLAEGITQKNIPAYLEAKQIKPASLSSVEKQLNTTKTALNIFTNEQLIAYCKDKKII
jgi:DNA-binding NarL/FixJ family response regulator